MKVADKSREPVAEELAVLRRRIAELEKLEAGHKQAEEQLRKYREHLEELVEERTADLTTTNEQLQQEITKCKRAEEILQESERKYRSLFDNMLNGFAYCKILVDENNQPIDFIYLEVNDAFERLTGLRREDVIGRKVTEAIPGTKESHPGLFGIYGKVALTGEATEFDIDFKPLGISLAISVYSPQKGYFIAVFEDITKRKQAEQEIQLLLTLTQAISESQDFDAALGIAIGKVCQATGWDFGEAWVPSHDGKVLECSLAWYSSSNSLEKFRKLSEELTFPPNTGLPGRVWSSKQPEWIPDVSVASKVLFPRAPIALEAGLKAGFGVPIIANGQVLVVFVFFRFKSLQEDPRLVELVSVVAAQLGSVIQRKQVEENMKQAEEAVRESEERYRSLLELGGQIGEAVVMLQDTAQGEAIQTFVSDEWTRITGYSREELLGRSFFSFVHPKHWAASEDRHRRRMAGESIPGLFEISIVKKDNTEVPIELTSAYTTYKGERANVVYIRDITARKWMEEQLITADRLASIGVLASGVAHELNNPLTGIIGFSELLLEKDVPDDIKEDLAIIHHEALRTAEVIKNLLAFGRKRAPLRQPVNVNSVIARVLGLRAYEQKVSNIHIETRFAHDLPQAMADSFQMQQVFLNIVINAEYFMAEAHKGGTLTITTERVGDMVRASFADDGPGISKESLGHLFDPFFTTKEVGKGTGLGLSICHGTVTEHGGRIYAESELGKGATFVVELPVTDADEEEAAK